MLLAGFSQPSQGTPLEAPPGYEKPLRIASPVMSPAIYIGRELVRAVYARAGLAVEFVELPFARSIHAAEMGEVDGELARAPSIVNQSSALVPLASPLTAIRIVTVRRRSEAPVTAMDQLQGMMVGHLNGMRTLAARLQRDSLVTLPASNEQLLELLDRGRLDVAVMMERDASVLVRHHPELEMGPELLVMPVYHYVQARHRDLIPLLSAAQDELAADGTLAAVEAQARRSLQEIYTFHLPYDSRVTGPAFLIEAPRD